MGCSIRAASDRMDGQHAMLAYIFASSIVANAMERDDDWFALAMVQLGVSEPVLRYYLAHGNSLLLANVIHVIHRVRDELLPVNLGMNDESWFLLLELAKFDGQNTLPELQHEFCTTWNEIVLGARSSQSPRPYITILSGIHQIYITLHQGTDAAPTAFTASIHVFDNVFYLVSSYPLCTIPGHRHLDSVPHSADRETTPPSTATPSTVTRHGVIPTTVPPSIRPDLHSLPCPIQIIPVRTWATYLMPSNPLSQ